MNNVWPFVRAERLALVADLEQLSGDQWLTPSLCGGWTVHDVVAHVVDTAKTSRLGFVRDMVVARFDFDRQNQRGVDRERATTPGVTLERLRATVDLRRSPPAPRDTRLVEAVVHGEDVRRPLGIVRDYETGAVVDALRLQARTARSWGGGKELVAGLSLRATDADLTHGEGPAVEGPALALLLAASGRPAGLDDLVGAGVETLRERVTG